VGEKEKEDEEEMRMAVTGKRETAKTQRTKRLFAALRNREAKNRGGRKQQQQQRNGPEANRWNANGKSSDFAFDAW
jgi:hypothetical protein